MDNKLASTQEFFNFCHNILDNIANYPFGLTINLEDQDLTGLKDNIKTEVFSPEVFGTEDEVSHILDETGYAVQNFLDNSVGMDIISANLYADEYTLVQFSDTDNPLEWVRRSLVLEAESYIVGTLRTEIRKATGKDPYNQSWELA